MKFLYDSFRHTINSEDTNINNKVEWHLVDLTDAYLSYIKAFNVYPEPTAFANGQLASIVRTPYLYYSAAMLQDRGFKSIVVGTTNRDEGAYIGFYGKASDGMVDLQPIADIHKSEVHKIAEILGVSKEIMDAKPAGDVYDGRVDEEMIGAPYWFLEMYLLMKCYNLPQLRNKLNGEDLVLFNKYADNIEALHRKNIHKYQVGSPAHYIDVLDRVIP